MAYCTERFGKKSVSRGRMPSPIAALWARGRTVAIQLWHAPRLPPLWAAARKFNRETPLISVSPVQARHEPAAGGRPETARRQSVPRHVDESRQQSACVNGRAPSCVEFVSPALPIALAPFRAANRLLIWCVRQGSCGVDASSHYELPNPMNRNHLRSPRL